MKRKKLNEKKYDPKFEKKKKARSTHSQGFFQFLAHFFFDIYVLTIGSERETLKKVRSDAHSSFRWF